MAERKRLPTPRLQLRWKKSDLKPGYGWECHYELVLPLGKFDIRAEQSGPRGGKRPNLKELVVAMKEPSIRSSTETPCTGVNGNRYYDPPFRDGAHASWDSVVLGNIPVYVIAPDGKVFSKADDDARRAANK